METCSWWGWGTPNGHLLGGVHNWVLPAAPGQEEVTEQSRFADCERQCTGGCVPSAVPRKSPLQGAGSWEC